ncbi:MAG: hypothetical protein HRU50_06115 [Winogradskyella sp.]|uniref:hypothetical protein n=1 Tax=Winogradskyella sp. TaxID=1883156 RepID=UPI0025EC8D91|nr:hypothetical protein [Winogradskyella sp.]NRB59506.1 hypothetical protein [Winogradskyella sp.]
MRKLILLFLIFQNISFAQNDTIKSFDVMTKTTYIDTLGQEVYYERINKTNDSLFFEDSNYRIIENKIVKYGDYYKHIRNGKLIKEEHHPKPKNIKTITLKDSLGKTEFVIKCQDNEIKEIDKYEKELLIFRAKYGLNNLSEEYEYIDGGFILSQKHYGIKTNYLVLLDEQSKEVVSKSKISEEIPVSIKEDADGYYFVPEDQDLESQLYSQFKKYCCHK